MSIACFATIRLSWWNPSRDAGGSQWGPFCAASEKGQLLVVAVQALTQEERTKQLDEAYEV